MLNKLQIQATLNDLFEMYPNAKCELNHSSPFELLVATVLSAQTTDKKVNEVTARLFDKYKTPEDFLNLSQEQLELEIKEIGLYKTKSKHILSLCKSLVENYNSEVPSTMEELITLDGVGRKTSNVVLSNAFDVPAIAVDTHVFRVANRIGLAEGKDVTKVEDQLMNNIPKEQWVLAHHTLIFHGRSLCSARKPKCSECRINNICEFSIKNRYENEPSVQ
jgi:endonuclease III